jgi:hypothetical protein
MTLLNLNILLLLTPEQHINSYYIENFLINTLFLDDNLLFQLFSLGLIIGFFPAYNGNPEKETTLQSYRSW